MKLLNALDEILNLPSDINKMIAEYVSDDVVVIGRRYYDLCCDGSISDCRLFEIVDRDEKNLFIRKYIKNGELGLMKKRNIVVKDGYEAFVFMYKLFYSNNCLPLLN